MKVFLRGKDALAGRQGTGSSLFRISSSVAEEQQTQLRGWEKGAGFSLALPIFISVFGMKTVFAEFSTKPCSCSIPTAPARPWLRSPED